MGIRLSSTWWDSLGWETVKFVCIHKSIYNKTFNVLGKTVHCQHYSELEICANNTRMIRSEITKIMFPLRLLVFVFFGWFSLYKTIPCYMSRYQCEPEQTKSLRTQQQQQRQKNNNLSTKRAFIMVQEHSIIIWIVSSLKPQDSLLWNYSFKGKKVAKSSVVLFSFIC